MGKKRFSWELWRHKSYGDVWAVELLDGMPVRQSGPLAEEEYRFDGVCSLHFNFDDCFDLEGPFHENWAREELPDE